MKKLALTTFFLLFVIHFSVDAQNKPTISYGNNKNVGKYIKVNGTDLYYEVYGKGEPLLIIHSCNTDIKAMEYQIEYFKNTYKVIAIDSRGQGKSKMNTVSLSYDLMAEDFEKLINALNLKDVNILGWSDGGVIGLKMAIRNNVSIKKLIAMGANLRFDETAVNKWAITQVKEMRAKTLKMIKKVDKSRNWKKELQFDNLLVNSPNITHAELNKINIPVLITIGDRDIIKNQHAIEIHNKIAKSQLCIIPGANHGVPRNNSKVFNQIADRFLTETFDYNE